MIQSRMSGNVLHIDTTERRLMGLTIFNGYGAIYVHCLNSEDAEDIIKTLQKYQRSLRNKVKKGG